MIASFANKIFEVSDRKIYTFNSFSYGGGLNIETQENEGGKASTYVKGVLLETMSFTVPLHYKYVDVRAEIESWNQLRDAAIPYIFVLHNKQVSPNKWLLKSTTATPLFGVDGFMLSATLTLNFEEYAQKGSKTTSASSTRKAKNTEAVHKFSSEALALMAELEAEEEKRGTSTIRVKAQERRNEPL